MKNSILPALIICLVCIIACKKSSDKITPLNNSGPYKSVISVLQNWSPAPNIATINASTGGSFYTSKGCRVILPAGCFETMSGGNVTGNVQVQVQDFLTKSDMIFSGVLPISNGDPLISGGEFNISATQGGQPLRVKTFRSFTVNIPQFGANTAGMQLFTANAAVTTGTVNWAFKQPDTSKSSSILVVNGDTLTLTNDSFQYCNADKFMVSPNYQSFTINITGVAITDSSTIVAWAVYDNYKGMWPMNSIKNGVITEGHVPNIPVHFLVVGVINGNLYSGITATTPATGSSYTVALSQTDTTSLKNKINGL